MALAFDTVGWFESGGNTFTHNLLTVSSGLNRALLLWVLTQGSASPGISATYGGAAMTAVPGSGFGNATAWMQAFGLLNPAAGSNPTVISVTDTAHVSNIVGAALSFTGAAQVFVQAFYNPVTATATSAGPASVTVSSAPGDLVSGFFFNNQNANFTATNNNQLFNVVSSLVTNLCYAGNYAAGAASVIMNATQGGSALWRACGISIKALAAAAQVQAQVVS